MVEIFIPLWILAAINLGIYYQESNVVADKIASIATVTLAFVAFLPTINEKIPQTAIVKLIEMIIYFQIGTTFLTLLDSLSARKKNAAVYETTWYSNGYFMVTLIINIVCCIIVFAMFTLHKLWWEGVYLKPQEDKKTGKLDIDLWENKDCDKEFRKWIVEGKVSALNSEAKPEKIMVSSEKR